jgi:hypothetical protein
MSKLIETFFNLKKGNFFCSKSQRRTRFINMKAQLHSVVESVAIVMELDVFPTIRVCTALCNILKVFFQLLRNNIQYLSFEIKQSVFCFYTAFFTLLPYIKIFDN